MPRTAKTQRKGQNSPSMEIVDKDRRVDAEPEGGRGYDWNFHHLSGHPTLRRLNINNHELTDAKIAFLPSLPELRSLHMRLPTTLTTLEATLMRCPKLRKLNYDLYYFDPQA